MGASSPWPASRHPAAQRPVPATSWEEPPPARLILNRQARSLHRKPHHDTTPDARRTGPHPRGPALDATRARRAARRRTHLASTARPRRPQRQRTAASTEPRPHSTATRERGAARGPARGRSKALPWAKEIDGAQTPGRRGSAGTWTCRARVETVRVAKGRRACGWSKALPWAKG